MDGEDELRRRVKRELRKRALSVRKATPLEACLARSEALVTRLIAMPEVAKAQSVALFWPMESKHEVDLRGLDASLRGRGARVAYPALVPTAEDAPPPGMTFHFTSDPSELVERGSIFAEPLHTTPPLSADLSELDIVVVPALVVDSAGYRIGYGAGYYNHALASSKALKVGVIFDFQLASEIPRDPHDVPVDWVVTDRRTMKTT